MENLITDDYVISDNKELLQIDRIAELLHSTYWATERCEETIIKSIEHSMAFGVYRNGVQIGLARCVTDYSTVYYICDVVIHEDYRGMGFGKMLLNAIINHKDLKDLKGMLATRDAFGFYEKYGFVRKDNFMSIYPNRQ